MGPLNERTCRLIRIGAAVVGRSEDAVHSNARRTLEAGATRAEIHHALLILINTIGFPVESATISRGDDILSSVGK